MSEIIIDLPMPPSTNRIWRRGRKGMIKSDEYVEWIQRADDEVMAAHALRGVHTINGGFSVLILLNATQRRGDSDNRIKAVLDWAQSRRVVHNDSDCLQGFWAWVENHEAPLGCRLKIRPMEGRDVRIRV